MDDLTFGILKYQPGPCLIIFAHLVSLRLMAWRQLQYVQSKLFTEPKIMCKPGPHIEWRVRDFSVWPIRSEPLRSRDFSVLVVPVSRHFAQTMKYCRNLICSLFNANILESTKGFIKKNYKHDPRSNSQSASTYDFHYHQQAN